MFGIFERKKDPYLEAIGAILHQIFKSRMPLDNAYNVAEECLGKLRNDISSGAFQDGANPDEKIMAYYCLCTMIEELEQGGDDETKGVCLVAAIWLKVDIDNFQDTSPLEKGICLYGEHVISN
jgi:hypothetical protein